MEASNLKKLNEVEGKEECQFKISNKFPALENLDDDVDITRACGTVRVSIGMSAKESPG
jgi:hypothetical protein